MTDLSLNEELRAPGTEPGGPAALVRMHGIVKEFPGVRANDGVDFDVRAGEVHALLGENGAGKSTLMHLLAGLLRPTAGSIEIDGEPVALSSPRVAIEQRVGMVHQHFRLVERFTVAENVTLGWHTPKHLIKPRQLEREIGELSASYGMPVAPERPVWQLSVGEQQRVEILKNLYRGARILILDEPTAVLTPQDAQGLFDSMRQMAADGRGLIFISHKLDEVMAVADRVTVLTRGRNVATVQAAETSAAQLARLMIGRDLPSRSRSRQQPAGESLLRLEDVSARDARGLPALRGVELEVRAGEIVGVAGVAGNGQRELAETIVGLRPATSGRVLLRGRDVTRWKVRRRARAGIGYSPEDRQREGLAASLSLLDNLCARRYRDLSLRERRAFADTLLARFDIRGADVGVPAGALSGGNAQKLLLAREISADPWLLVAAQPTRGLDLGAADAAHDLLVGLRDAGRAVLLVSEDLDELIGISDRVVVMYEGRITGSFDSAEADVERLGLLMAGRAA